MGFGLPIALGIRLPGTYAQGSVALALVAGAYMAETMRAGIEAVPRGQMEAARSLGMSHARAMVSIVIPQAFRIIIPPLTNEIVLLLKDTSLVSVLGVTAANKELTRFARDGVISTCERNTDPGGRPRLPGHHHPADPDSPAARAEATEPDDHPN